MRIVMLFVMIVGLLLTGCGTSENTSNVDQGGDELTTGSGGTGDDSTEVDEENGNGIVEGDLVPSIQEDGTLKFLYSASNQTEEEITLEFSSSQRFDYSIESEDGTEIYLFSSLAMFLQEMGEEELKQGEELVYNIDLNDIGLDPGKYTLKAWMTPIEGGRVSEESMEFTVE